MQARKIRKKVWKRRIQLTPSNYEAMCRKWNVALTTLKNKLDISNPNNTAFKSVDIQVDAINNFGGVITEYSVVKEVLDIQYD